jgi:hypothetical protein
MYYFLLSIIIIILCFSKFIKDYIEKYSEILRKWGDDNINTFLDLQVALYKYKNFIRHI